MEKMIIDNDTFFADVLRVLEEGKQVTIPVKGYSPRAGPIAGTTA